MHVVDPELLQVFGEQDPAGAGQHAAEEGEPADVHAPAGGDGAVPGDERRRPARVLLQLTAPQQDQHHGE